VTENPVVRYTAAGGVVVRPGQVLVFRRLRRDEVRLTKGQLEPGESAREAALRETQEESGYRHLVLKDDLGRQVVEFDYQGRHVIRRERYFWMTLAAENASSEPDPGEKQFDPVWLAWDEALAALTFAAEREWVRRARQKANE
jgi:8-oxo-dGTP diphosphatase